MAPEAVETIEPAAEARRTAPSRVMRLLEVSAKQLAAQANGRAV